MVLAGLKNTKKTFKIWSIKHRNIFENKLYTLLNSRLQLEALIRNSNDCKGTTVPSLVKNASSILSILTSKDCISSLNKDLIRVINH